MKKSFVLYVETFEVIKKLDMQQRGQLLTALFEYCGDGIVPELDPLTDIIFTVIRSYLDENQRKYTERCERNRQNANKRWDATASDGIRPHEVAQGRTKSHYDSDSDSDSDSASEKINSDAERRKPSRKGKEKTVKHQYGEFSNVLLSDQELEKLKEKFPDWKQRVEKLSIYMRSSGKSYRDHYVTILSWFRREEEEQKQRPDQKKRAATYDYQEVDLDGLF